MEGLDVMAKDNAGAISTNLSGSQKVAAVLLALDKDVSQNLLKHFDQVELRRIAKTAAALGSVPAASLDIIFEELSEQLAHDGVDLIGTVGQAEQLLSGALDPEQVAEIMSEVLGNSNEQFWKRLESISEATLGSYLTNEHPQTIAIILSRVNFAYAGKVLGQLSSELRNEVVRRMLVMGPVSDAALRIIETSLQEDLMGSTGSTATKGSNARVAAIINQMESSQIEEILAAVAGTEPGVADELKKMLFTFDDIPKLSQRARLILFDQVPTDRLILALRGAASEIREAVLPALSARMRRMVETELASSDMPPKREIVRAQRLISETVLRLAEQGTITLGVSED